MEEVCLYNAAVQHYTVRSARQKEVKLEELLVVCEGLATVDSMLNYVDMEDGSSLFNTQISIPANLLKKMLKIPLCRTVPKHFLSKGKPQLLRLDIRITPR